MFLGLCNEVTLFVGEFAADNLDKVNEVAYTEYACGEKPDNAGADFAYIEAVYSEAAEKEAENKGGKPILGGGVRRYCRRNVVRNGFVVENFS